MKRDWIATARTLSEALPYLQRYDGARVVVKFGGHAMGDAAALERFARDIVLMKQCNVHPIIVHGGGPQIEQLLKRLAINSQFVDGLRVTDEATVEVVEMVLAGRINKAIVTALNRQGGKAVGLSGKDADLMVCEKTLKTTRDPESNIEKVLDLGFVGTPTKVNPGLLETFIASDYIPVIAPVGVGVDGETFNVNGDTAAGAIAGAMKAERLLLLTDVAGVKGEDGEVMAEITKDKAEALIASGVISGGMIPKCRTALDAIEAGVDAVVILDGRAPHACLLELFTSHGAGTMITSN
ncbi:N-acetylglutamate kinase [Albimonas donghaensis]|uniref:Acetylglutamate kinase n=1 Tax=Albimonas donghaensis TaxID=356660 RepID=A0A1H2VCU4_9RHOB|nr:acetylglutamate kinase [Albimonas donghaensis]SDW66122.1 N-acetylglutamate kinase [Albimonas donghaensis]